MLKKYPIMPLLLVLDHGILGRRLLFWEHYLVLCLEDYKAIRRLSDGMKNPLRVDPLWRSLRIGFTDIILLFIRWN